MKQIIDTLEHYFGKKAPQIPGDIKEIIVKIVPYLAILGLLFCIPPTLALFGFYGRFGYGYWGGYGSLLMLWEILTLVMLILYVAALPGLFKRTHKAWNYLFYISLVSLIRSLIVLDIIGLILGFVIEMYLLFQIRSYYVKSA